MIELLRELTDMKVDGEGQPLAILNGDETHPIRMRGFHPIDAGIAIIDKLIPSRRTPTGVRMVPEAVRVRLPAVVEEETGTKIRRATEAGISLSRLSILRNHPYRLLVLIYIVLS